MRVPLKARDQAFGAAKLQVMVAPMEFTHRIKTMFFNRLDDGLVKRPRLTGDAKGAVFRVPPGAPGDLRHLGGGQPPLALTVEFREASKGDMIDIEIEPHPDRIGGGLREHGDPGARASVRLPDPPGRRRPPPAPRRATRTARRRTPSCAWRPAAAVGS